MKKSHLHNAIKESGVQAYRYQRSGGGNLSFQFCVFMHAATLHDDHSMVLVIVQLWDMDTMSFYTTSQSIEMCSIMEGSHSCKVMEYPVVENYHLNFVCLCCNMTWWPLHGVSHCSHFKIWIQSHSIQLPRQLRCPTSWRGLITVKLWNIQW